VITREVALSASSRADQLDSLLERAGFEETPVSTDDDSQLPGLRLAGA
jgi:hypothetical protein